MACVLGKNMIIQPNESIQSPIVIHEALHVASSSFQDNGDKTITWKSGIEESKAPSKPYSTSSAENKTIKNREKTKLLKQSAEVRMAKRQEMKQAVAKMRQAAEERRNNISGMGNLTPEEKKKKYKEAALAWETKKAEKEEQNIDKEHDSSGVDR